MVIFTLVMISNVIFIIECGWKLYIGMYSFRTWKEATGLPNWTALIFWAYLLTGVMSLIYELCMKETPL